MPPTRAHSGTRKLDAYVACPIPLATNLRGSAAWVCSTNTLTGIPALVQGRLPSDFARSAPRRQFADGALYNFHIHAILFELAGEAN
jgi:hypothetical protein